MHLPGVAVDRPDDDQVIAEITGLLALLADREADVPHVFICRNHDEQMLALFPAFLPMCGDATDRGCAPAGDQQQIAILHLSFQRLGRTPVAPQQGGLTIALKLLSGRSEDLGDGIGTERLGQEANGGSLDRLRLFGVAKHHQLKAVPALESGQFQHLPAADQGDLVHDDDATLVELILALRRPPQEWVDGRDVLRVYARVSQRGGLAPCERCAEHLAPVVAPSVNERLHHRALPGSGNADPKAQPATRSELLHHRPLGSPLLTLSVDLPVSVKEGRSCALDLVRCQ